MAKPNDINKENDKFSKAGTRAVYRQDILRKAINEAMKKPEMKASVQTYIFCGDPDAVSPLQEIRDENSQ